MTRIDGRGRRPESRRPEPGSWQDHYELCHLAGQVALAHVQAGEPYAPPGPPDPETVRVFARGAAHYGRLTLKVVDEEGLRMIEAFQGRGSLSVSLNDTATP